VKVWWIVAGFLAVQGCIIWFAANGPFVDEGLYTVAGMRVLEGKAASDGYSTWFNGSPFVWPVLAALGHHLGGLEGARFMAAILSTLTLVAFTKTAENLFGESVSAWCALAFGVNGLFMALAHFAVYDVVALAGLAVSMWCLTRPPTSGASIRVIAAGLAFAGAVIAKYGYLPMVVPLLGLLVCERGITRSGRALALFLSVAGVTIAAYFWLLFGSLVPASSAAYFGQAFERSRGHIAVLQLVFALVPLALASVGAVVAWRRGERLLVVTCLLAMSLYPAFHLWTANFVSAQKHVVAGFLFAYLLAGLALERLWTSRSRPTAVIVLAMVTLWGGLQCYWQDHSWSDTRALAHHLAVNMKRGDRIVAESSWNYILYLYPRGFIESPADVIDATYPPRGHRRDACDIPWLVGNPASADMIRDAVRRCGHQPVLSSTTQQYYFDTTRLRLGVYSVVVSLYRLPNS
jgi:4-amino-4-deoxy-L-arabinose transferase-like glycosyltransferase